MMTESRFYARETSRRRWPVLLATVAFVSGQAAGQVAGRSAHLVLSDSLTVVVWIGSADSSVVAYTPHGGFRLRADSTALANWAKATAALPPPRAAAGKGPDDRSVLSGAVLRASDGSGNAMRLLRLSEDSAPEYQLAGSNGAWEFREKVPANKGALLLAALRGEQTTGLDWTAIDTLGDRRVPDFKPAEAAPDNPRPRYPPKAELAQASGTVVAQFRVGVDGRARMESLIIVRASHPLFALAVRDVLPSMHFKPATLHGIPVEQQVAEEFQFQAR
jgi:hypothetical protein